MAAFKPTFWETANVDIEAKAEIANKAIEVNFEHSYRLRVDREHWAVLKSAMKYAREFNRPFFIHMLEAFGNGDRFIVAKLAYDGGAA